MTLERFIIGLLVVIVIIAFIAVQFKKNGKEFPWIRALGITVSLALLLWLGSCIATSSIKKTVDIPTDAPTAVVPARQVVQMPDRMTPCTMEIAEIRDLYTDGEAIYALPPEWPENKAILYSGKGHLVIQGGNIHSGVWKFWAADSNRVALIRVFAVVK